MMGIGGGASALQRAMPRAQATTKVVRAAACAFALLIMLAAVVEPAAAQSATADVLLPRDFWQVFTRRRLMQVGIIG